MNITLNGTKVTQDTKTLAFEGNSGVDAIVVTVDTDESWTYKLDVDYANEKCCCGDDHYNVIQLSRDGNTCTAVLTMDMLPYSGKYSMQLRAINDDGRVYHSEIFDGWVKRSINPWKTYNPVPSEFLQIEENVTQINNHPPYPDSSGFWMIWNQQKGKYELSDIPAATGSGDKTFVFTQSTASNRWVIKHDLNKYPCVSVVDTGNNVVVGQVEYIDLNNCVCTFTSAFSGKAYLN